MKLLLLRTGAILTLCDEEADRAITAIQADMEGLYVNRKSGSHGSYIRCSAIIAVIDEEIYQK